MTPSRGKIHVPVVVLAILLLQACTPTRPPIDEIDQASRALGDARSAEAPVLAAEEYRAAVGHFDQAQAAESTHDYAAAAQFARESMADSELARALSRRGKLREAVQALRQENATLARDLDDHPARETQP
ncbi:MAG: DUF4398 domain-containing protein [Dokdonella sp.]